MGKKWSYLAPRKNRPWSFEDYDKAATETDIKFVSGLTYDKNDEPQAIVPENELPKSIENYGPLNQPRFISTLSHSRVLVGVGLPVA